MDTWRPIVDAETDVALQQAAAGAGILLPAPVRSRSVPSSSRSVVTAGARTSGSTPDRR